MCTTTFDAHAHGIFGVGSNIIKWPKQQVWDDIIQRTNAKYEMSQAPLEELCRLI